MSLGLLGPETAADESEWSRIHAARHRLVLEFGLENAAFANLAQDMALYQIAVADGHSPQDQFVMAEMGRARERFGGLRALLDLQELARESDFEGFRNLAESSSLQQLIPVQGEEHLVALFEEAREMDLSGAVEGMEIHATLLESVGAERYWNEISVEHIRRLVAIENFRLSVDRQDTGQTAGLDWQDLREKTWGGTVVRLTDAAPQSITMSAFRSYMNGYHALERDLLIGQQERVRPTPAPGPTLYPSQ